MKRPVKVLIGILAWIGISLLGMYRGCYSATLPPVPPAEALAKVRSTHFQASVGVEKYKWPVYTDSLVASLRKTGLFDRVERLEDLPDAQLVARVERPIYGTATIPILPIVSFGLIPSIADERWGEVFSLRSNTADAVPIPINFSYKGPTTLGWWAAVRSLSPDVSTSEPPETERFRDALSAVICAKADEITGMIEKR